MVSFMVLAVDDKLEGLAYLGIIEGAADALRQAERTRFLDAAVQNVEAGLAF